MLKSCGCHEEHSMLTEHGHKLETLHTDLHAIGGILQQLLRRFEESMGIPKGIVFSYSQASPAKNQTYSSPAVGQDGVCRSLVLSGSGNVTLTLQKSDNLNDLFPLGTFSMIPGNPIVLPHHFIVPVRSLFQLSTDSSSASNLAISAWIEPFSMTGEDMFRMRR